MNETTQSDSSKSTVLMKISNTRDIMRLVYIQGASGENAHFRRHLLEAQQNRAQVNRQRKEEAERKKREETHQLTSVGLVLDRDVIVKMTVPQL
jgi:hypothetical protein